MNVMELSERLLALTHAELEENGNSYTVTIPEPVITNANLRNGDLVKVGVMQPEQSVLNRMDRSTRKSNGSHDLNPPVEEGEQHEVEIENMGEEGDGIARIDNYVVIVKGSVQPGDRVTVEISDTLESFAIANVVNNPDNTLDTHTARS